MFLFLPTITVLLSLAVLFLALSIVGGLWIGTQALAFSDTPKPKRPYRVVIAHTYSPKRFTLFGWKIAIPKRGRDLMKKTEDLARKRGLPIFLPVGAITVPGSKQPEASVYAEYLRTELDFKGGVIVSGNLNARDTRTCVKIMRSFVTERNAAPALVLATRAHLPRMGRLLKESGAKSENFEFVAVHCSFRHYIWEFWMYVVDIVLLPPESWVRKLILDAIGRKA